MEEMQVLGRLLNFLAILLGILVGGVFNILMVFFLRPRTYGRNGLVMLILALSGVIVTGIACDLLTFEMEGQISNPFGLSKISFWLAVTSITLFTASEFLSSQNGRLSGVIEGGRLRTIALVFGAFYLSTLALRIYQIILIP